MRMVLGLKLKQPLFAADKTLVANPKEKLCILVNEFISVCEK